MSRCPGAIIKNPLVGGFKFGSPQSTMPEQLAAELKVWLLDPTGEAARGELMVLCGKH